VDSNVFPFTLGNCKFFVFNLCEFSLRLAVWFTIPRIV
jgi:hypothetical protein